MQNNATITNIIIIIGHFNFEKLPLILVLLLSTFKCIHSNNLYRKKQKFKILWIR
jgi:hypothetical protein